MDISLPTPLLCLLAFAGWGILLLMGIVLWRFVDGVRRLRGVGDRSSRLSGRQFDEWYPAGREHGTPAYWRLNRAYANVLETLPFFGAVVLAGLVVGLDTPLFSSLAAIVVIARIAQSTAHVSSPVNGVILVRATAFLVQIVSIVWMGLHLLAQAGHA